VSLADLCQRCASAGKNGSVGGRPTRKMSSVVAELQLTGMILADRILTELAVALSAQVEPLPPVDILADQRIGFVFRPFQDLMQLHQMIPIIVLNHVTFDGFHHRVHFDSHAVA
jgi:hypothetical protein